MFSQSQSPPLAQPDPPMLHNPSIRLPIESIHDIIKMHNPTVEKASSISLLSKEKTTSISLKPKVKAPSITSNIIPSHNTLISHNTQLSGSYLYPMPPTTPMHPPPPMYRPTLMHPPPPIHPQPRKHPFFPINKGHLQSNKSPIL